MLKRLAQDVIRCDDDFDDRAALMDSGIDSLSATTFINSLESQWDILLAGTGVSKMLQFSILFVFLSLLSFHFSS